MDGKQGHWQLDSSRVHLPVFLLLIVWNLFVTLSRSGRVIRVYSARTHSTILVYASTLHCKFVCVWKLTRKIHGPTNWQFMTNDPVRHGNLLFQQRTLVSPNGLISTKNLGVLGTAPLCISKGFILTKNLGVP